MSSSLRGYTVPLCLLTLAISPLFSDQGNSVHCVRMVGPTWSATERWVWSQICSGKSADLNHHDPDQFDPKERRDSRLEDNRLLSSRFIENVLLDSSYQNATTRHGVIISNAYFPDYINLNHGRLSSPVELTRSRFEKPFAMTLLRSSTYLSLEESVFVDILRLPAASIDGDVVISRASIACLNMTSAIIKGHLVMRNVVFPELGDGNGDTRYSEGCRALATPLVLDFAAIGGNLDMQSTKSYSNLAMRSVSIRGDLLMKDVEFDRSLRMSEVEVGDRLDMTDAKFDVLNLRSATVGGELVITSAATRVAELHGFSYDRIGYGDGHPTRARERAGHLLRLMRTPFGYTYQPYHRLASVLRNEGVPLLAERVLFIGKEEERKDEQTPFGEMVKLHLLKHSVGYGIGTRTLRALIPAVVLVVIGCVFLSGFQELQSIRYPVLGRYGFWFSLDYLLPVVKLNSVHYDEFNIATGFSHPFTRAYFYVHQLLGWILSVFLIAGLSKMII